MTTLALDAVSAARSSAYRKTAWRLMPFLMLCYLCAYLDRVNVGFAKLQMMDDLALSEAVYGLGAGMFFIAPIVAGTREIGVLYADSRLSGRALRHEQFVAFQRFTQLAGRCLEAISRR